MSFPKIKKFKRGELIQVRSWKSLLKRKGAALNQNKDIVFNGIRFTRHMRKFCGRLGVITKVTPDYYRVKFQNRRTKSDYYFCDNMLKKYHFKKRLHKKYIKNTRYNKGLL